MSLSSGSAPLLPPAATSCAITAETKGKVTGRKESISSEMESYLKKHRLGDAMRKETEAEKQMYRNEMKEKMPDITFNPKRFGDQNCPQKLKKSLLRHSIVSIALFNEDRVIYACSGTAVRHWHDNIRDHHRIFVTSVHLALKFEENRTRDDNLRIKVCTSDGDILHGFLGLYDEATGIAVVTSFSLKNVYTMDTTDHSLNRKLIAFGCATDGALMGAHCSSPRQMHGFLMFSCREVEEIGLGGPVISFGPDGSEHIAGIIVKSYRKQITTVPTPVLHDWLQRLLEITSKTCHFRGYSLPKGVKTVIPSGFMVESKILQSLGYPLPPPLLFELNGRIAGRFEEHFGQFHYWKGYPFDYFYHYGPNRIWDQLGEGLVQKISGSVVSIASFKDGKRCFACTGLLIKGRDCPLVLTSASLVRNGATGKIDRKLKIEVFLPPNDFVEGVLELYHQNYNIAVVGLKNEFATAICPQDILNEKESNKKSVVAIGRCTKQSHGLLMASMGEVKGKYNSVTNRKNKSTRLAKKIDCKELRLSTCEIKKVGIGGPLVGMDGRFIGMNFYDESGTTPFLPRKEILAVLCEWFDMLERNSLVGCPVNIEAVSGHLSSKRPRTARKMKTNRWPVSKPYWYLPGQTNIVDQFVGKVLM